MQRSASPHPISRMTAAVTADATVPIFLAIALGGARTGAIAGALTLGLSAGTFRHLRKYHSELITFGYLRRHVFTSRQVFHWSTLSALAVHMNYFMFAWAIALVGTAAATVLFNAWALPYVFILYMANRYVGTSNQDKAHYWDRPTSRMVFLIVLAVAGVSMVIIGQARPHEGVDTSAFDAIIGGLLALAGAIAVGISASNFIWARRLAETMNLASESEQRDFETGSAILVQCLSALLMGTVFTVTGIASDMGRIGYTTLLVAFVVGYFFRTTTSVQTRVANRESTNPGINAIAYLSPIMSLVGLYTVDRLARLTTLEWLYIDAGLVDINTLVIGTAAVMSVTLLVNFDPEPNLIISRDGETVQTVHRWGYASLVLALWFCGTFVVYREELLESLGIKGLVWDKSDVWGLLALAATVFALLLSFRLVRIADRTRHEETAFLGVLRAIEVMERQLLIDHKLRCSLWQLDHSASMSEISARYRAAREAFETETSEFRRRDSAMMSDVDLTSAEVALDSYFKSKQSGRDLPELIALTTLGSLVLFVALLARPPVIGLGGALTDIFAVLFSATTVFMLSNLLDLRRSRDAAVLGPWPADDTGFAALALEVDPHHEKTRERAISLALAFAVFDSFSGLLLAKWL